MSQYIVSANYPASQEEIEQWNLEAQYFNFQEGKPGAQEGWGIPEVDMPPFDVVERVMAKFKSQVANFPLTDGYGQPTQLRPQFKWSVLSAVMAHFLWFTQKEGVEYIQRIHGIEEVPAFWSGYTYYYQDPNTGNPVRLTEDSEWQLRIWRELESKDQNPAIVLPDEENMIHMQTLMGRVRDPNAQTENPVAGDDMYQWVSAEIHEWLIEEKVDYEWPMPRKDRVSGYHWVRTHEKEPGIPYFDFINNVSRFGRQTYRIMDSRGGKLWCGVENIESHPNRDLYRHNGQMSDHQIENTYRCICCGKIRNCVPLTGDHHHLCAWCYGNTIERDERPTLDYCTRLECGGKNSSCPKYMPSKRELISLKSKLNRETEYPVYRE